MSSIEREQDMLNDQWRKSTLSGDNGDSAEVRIADDGSVEVRESEEPAVAVRFTPQRWRNFIGGVKAGEFDLPD
jgi:hypothetical protein